MTTSHFTASWARQAMPLVGLLLFAACGRQSPSPAARTGEDSTTTAARGELRICDEPELQPLGDAGRARTTLPVAYPGEVLEGPIRVARPFPLADRQSPTLGTDPPRPMIRDVRPLPESTELAPPVVVSEAPLAGSPPPTNRLAARPMHLTSPAHTQMAKTLPPLPAQPAQTEPMETVTRRAEQMIRHGYHLAERGALYSARAEFIQALRTIAQAIDLRNGNRDHTQALADGLTTLEEAEDFVPEGSRLESDLDVAMLVRAHHTPACKHLELANLLPVTALQQYYSYAQEQLVLAAGGEEAASMALFGLGKTYTTLAVEKTLPVAIAEPKAMVFHWSALLAHSGNFLAANELAVLEARWGQFATARSLLQYSVAILPHSVVWRNLAVVHERLGETKLAELARREADVVAQREAVAQPGNPEGIVPSSDVEWLDSKSFASTTRSEIDVQKPTQPEERSAAAPPKPAVTPAPPRQRTAAAWFNWFR
ncbi:MAG TPA: hypothetical protein VFI31_28570 [Pirellulales bacterium]|nr:hypothetical protein [Pirellulales bacterium]